MRIIYTQQQSTVTSNPWVLQFYASHTNYRAWGVSNCKPLVSRGKLKGLKWARHWDASAQRTSEEPTRLQHAQGVLLLMLWVQKPIREPLIFSEALPAQETHKTEAPNPSGPLLCPSRSPTRERGLFITLFTAILHLPEQLLQVLVMQPGHHRSPLHSSISRSLSLHQSSAASVKTRHWGEHSANKPKLFWRARLKKQHWIFKKTKEALSLQASPQQTKEWEPEPPPAGTVSYPRCGLVQLVLSGCSWAGLMAAAAATGLGQFHPCPRTIRLCSN